MVLVKTPEEACQRYVSKFNASEGTELEYAGIYQYIDISFHLCGEPEGWLPATEPACLIKSGSCNGVANIHEIYENKYKIKISKIEGSSPSAEVIANVRPKNTRGNYSDTVMLIARVYDNNDNLILNVDIEIDLDVIKNSGDHIHDDDARHEYHAGQISNSSPVNILEGNTGELGLIFVFTPPEIAGDHNLVASCVSKKCTQFGPDKIHVGIDDLYEITPSNDGTYTLIGDSKEHPSNHWVTESTYYKVLTLSGWYHQQFPDNPPLHLNDASLQYGGILDFSNKHRWAPPHRSHRNGDIIDVRANPTYNPGTAIPKKNFYKFRRLCTILGGIAEIHSKGTSNQHFHLDF